MSLKFPKYSEFAHSSYKEFLEKGELHLEKYIRKCKEEDPHYFPSSVIMQSLENLHNAFRLRKDRETIYKYLVLRLEGFMANFLMLSNIGKPVHYSIGGVEVETIGTDRLNESSMLAWIMAVEMAILLRRKDAIRIFMAVPQEILMKQGGPKPESYDFKEYLYFKSLFGKGGDVPAAFKALYEATDPKNLRPGSEFFVLSYWVPVFDTHYAVLRKDVSAFNHHLEQILICQDKYHKKRKQEDDEYGDPAPFSEAILAVASLGHEQGLKMTVESDYLPKWIVEGDFPST